MRRSVTIKRSADGGLIELRAGEKVLGGVSNLQGHSDQLMTGTFSHRPAYADFAAQVLALARALDSAQMDEVNQLRAALEAAHVEVWHTSHDMRIDKPRTIVIRDGQISFTPNDAFIMMRTGGL